MRMIVVHGPPAAGKTTLAERLAKDTGLPLLAKDGLKEFLFDMLGVGDREWSAQLGRVTIGMVWQLAELMLAAGKSFIIENAFYAELAELELAAMAATYQPTILQIYCTAEPAARVSQTGLAPPVMPATQMW